MHLLKYVEYLYKVTCKTWYKYLKTKHMSSKLREKKMYVWLCFI